MITCDVNQKTVRVLVVNNQKTVRRNLKLYLESNSQIKVVDVAEDAVAAWEKIATLQPDIAIIDLELPGMNGIATIKTINERFSQTKTLALSNHDEQEYIYKAVVAGAKGYLKKGSAEEQLNEAVLKVNQGYFFLDAKLKLDAKSLEKIALDSSVNLEDKYRFSATEVEAHETEAKTDENYSEDLSNELSEMRSEIVGIVEYKSHLLESKDNQINLSFQQLQRKFYWLLASQLILVFMVIGVTSSLLKLKQQGQANIQNGNQTVNVVDTSQSVKSQRYHQ